MTNVVSLERHRAKKGLPPARTVAERPVIERILDSYCKFDLFKDRKVQPTPRLRQVAILCAKKIVRLVEGAGAAVDDSARFQFFAAGQQGAEVLQVRVSRVCSPKGSCEPLVFQMCCNTLTPAPLSQVSRREEVFKPLLTLPMSRFYRLR
jgi:hypothetical protein